MGSPARSAEQEQHKGLQRLGIRDAGRTSGGDGPSRQPRRGQRRPWSHKGPFADVAQRELADSFIAPAGSDQFGSPTGGPAGQLAMAPKEPSP